MILFLLYYTPFYCLKVLFKNETSKWQTKTMRNYIKTIKSNKMAGNNLQKCLVKWTSSITFFSACGTVSFIFILNFQCFPTCWDHAVLHRPTVLGQHPWASVSPFSTNNAVSWKIETSVLNLSNGQRMAPSCGRKWYLLWNHLQIKAGLVLPSMMKMMRMLVHHLHHRHQMSSRALTTRPTCYSSVHWCYSQPWN